MIIRVLDGPDAAQEWDLIELQGVVRPLDDGDLAGKVVGRLTYSNGRSQIQVGNMLLEGHVITLAKPYVMLEKVDDPEPVEGGAGVKYLVAGVVRRQFLFRTSRHRPPIN
ncbi:hypothetical protein DIPPA_01240 [Diplonema papillatum]|nr:hypothetical protein DIPPA_01240 [Diplonema papillatum]